MNRLLVSDLDGTLAFGGHAPVPGIMRELEKAADATDTRLVLATSRSPRSVRAWFGPLADRIDLVCCNGALVLTRDGRRDRTAIAPDLLAEMLRELSAAAEPFCLEYGDHFVASSRSALPWMGGPGHRVLQPGQQPPLDGVLKLCVAHADPWAPRLQALTRTSAEVFPHETGDADVVAGGVTKADAVRGLTADVARVTAFGNDLNDLEMLRVADHAVVVGTGLPGLDALPHVRRVPAEDGAVLAALTQELTVPVGCPA